MATSNFFNKHTYELGKPGEPNIVPGNIITILSAAVQSYYETYYRDREQPKNYFNKIIHGGEEQKDYSNVFVQIDKACSHEYLIRFYSSIIFFQQFVELYIVKLLDKISPSVSRTKFKDNDIVKYLSQCTSDEQPGEKTLPMTQILQRMQRLFKADPKIDSRLCVLTDKTFLMTHLETIRLLQEMRNDVAHSGKRVLTHYGFEMLFVKKVFPMVKVIVSAEANTTSLNRKLTCGLNIIDEICKIKLPEDPTNPSVYERNKKKLMYLT
jgi:hypothetical protein